MLDQLVSDAQGALAGDIDMVCIDYMIVFCVWILKLAALFELWKIFPMFVRQKITYLLLGGFLLIHPLLNDINF